MQRTNKRNELIRVGSEIVVREGFNAASINKVLNAAGVPKGSFYYYFSSKEEFGLAIVDDFAERYRAKLKDILEDSRFSPLRRLHNYFAAKIDEMETCQFTEGCLIGNLAQELAAKNELFRDRFRQVFAEWEQYFMRCLKEAYEAGEIREVSNFSELAEFILSSWEGAILRAKVNKSTEPLRIFVKILFQQVLCISDFSKI